ncbi:adenosylcobinamide-GDP ribazoletransferase [Vibrio sonorensis]|uniref:adenosylcobinamide-GDP ribazoletransferase n=1 Tax=Vibrio sonorensis TaxID=1004316 RepID=UPI0008DAEB74|nr:adenosylcobinamide-GDP ribazoletransferase [Vibrio sonorensis]
MQELKYQWQLFLLALGFFSRLPVPKDLPYSEQRMNQAGRYFALVGALLGVCCAAVYSVAAWLFPVEIAVFITMVFSLLLTGAFHEDGLTDMADGIGGGMTREKRLNIMKDSRIGTYGASALIMILLGKYVSLVEIANIGELSIVLIAVYAVSRAVAATLIYDMPYVTDLDNSKSKPLAQRQSKKELALLILTGLIAASLLGFQIFIALAFTSILFRVAFCWWLKRRIGGFTGDCLGAAQQIMEVLCYLVVIALWRVAV